MDDLAQFLRKRLGEDEALALEAPPGPWQIGNAVDPTQPCNVNTFPAVRPVADGLNWLVAEHIARHDPARVLREVEAKRRAMGRHHDFQGRCAGCGNDLIHPITDCPELRDLAAAYADHPDYRAEWRP